MTDTRRHAPATERNREPILAILRAVLPARGTVLEIASGTGEHAVHFAAALPDLLWRPSDPDPFAIASCRAWGEAAGLPNLRPPLLLDASAADWPIAQADAILCINMVHISPWEATVGLIEHSAKLLSMGGPLVLYGPYFQKGVETAPSNMAFDESLRTRDSRWGLRQLEEVVALAESHGLHLESVHSMPANNRTIVLRRHG